MLINPSLYVFLVAAIILLSIILVSLVISYLATVRRLSKLEEKERDIYDDAKKKQRDEILQAEDVARGIIEDAKSARAEIVNSLNLALTSKSDELTKTFAKQASAVNNATLLKYKAMSDETLKYLEARFAEEFEKINKELAEYKKSQLIKIDNNIYNILLNISKIAFGRSISISQHEELITQALSEAQKDLHG